MKTGPEWPFPSLSGPEQSPVSSHPDSFLETRRVRGAGGGRGDEAAARILDGNPPRHLLTGKCRHLFLPLLFGAVAALSGR